MGCFLRARQRTLEEGMQGKFVEFVDKGAEIYKEV